jgi:type III restriction enzyme
LPSALKTTKTSKYTPSFRIDTLIGFYNPNWALVIDKDGEEKLYFVLETKGTEIEEFLRPEEKAKIDFARKHFEAISTNLNSSDGRKMLIGLWLRALSR